MKSISNKYHALRKGIKLAAVSMAIILGASNLCQAGGNGNPGVLPPHSKAFGKSLGEWSAAWWQWFLEHPLEGHPGIDTPEFDVASGQSGKVWFLASPFGTVERSVSVPPGTALLIGSLNAEGSDLEYGAVTPEEQLAVAQWLIEHVSSLSITIDDVIIENVDAYRVQSPQFSFTAPDPWIFSPAPSGAGTAVSDGYFVLLAPLSVGEHTIHIQGSFHFDAGEIGPDAVDFEIDTTYNITVSK